MKIFIVLTGYDYEGWTEVAGVFDTYAKAAELADKLNSKAQKIGPNGYADIEERIIQ